MIADVEASAAIEDGRGKRDAILRRHVAASDDVVKRRQAELTAVSWTAAQVGIELQQVPIDRNLAAAAAKKAPEIDDCSADLSGPIIERAEKMLLTPEGKAKLKTRLLPLYKKCYPRLSDDEVENLVDDAIMAMARRAARADKVLHRLNMRQGLPILPLHPPTNSDAAWPRLRLFMDVPDFSELRRAA